MFDLKGRAKWSSWDANKGMDPEKAKELYIAYVEELMVKYAE